MGSQELQGDAKCPQCRQACDSRDLRPCHPLRDLVEGYTAARLLLIQAAQLIRPAEPPQPSGRRMSQRVQKRQRSSQDEGAKHGGQQQPPQQVAKKDRPTREGLGSRDTQAWLSSIAWQTGCYQVSDCPAASSTALQQTDACAAGCWACKHKECKHVHRHDQGRLWQRAAQRQSSQERSGRWRV